MPGQFYLFLGAAILLMALGRVVVVWRRGPKAVDWELEVAFIRLDFPAEQRDIAQKIAAGLAAIVGTKIKRLKPEDRLEQIVGWAENPIQVGDLIKVLHAAYGIRCDADATFRVVVEKIAERWSQENHAKPAVKNS
jgi:hypothetical protein